MDLSNSELVKRSPLDGFLRPPTGLRARLGHYGRRYGYVRAVCSFVGRKYFVFWKLVGPALTRRYLRRWLNSPGPHILNLGGGGVLFHRWLTADVDPRSDVYVDVTRPLPFRDAAIDVVYCEEVIEHISRQDAILMLRECLRILKPGGWLRLTTPSLDYFARRALTDPNGTFEINDIFYLHGHRHIYSEANMRAFLEESRFIDIKRSSYRDPNSHYGYFDTHPVRFTFAPPECSQYWEARKSSA
jgi:predicted SAM-dependent methyltransferase